MFNYSGLGRFAMELASGPSFPFVPRRSGDSMANDQITVSVDADVAEAYRTASAEQRRKLDLLSQSELARRHSLQRFVDGNHV